MQGPDTLSWNLILNTSRTILKLHQLLLHCAVCTAEMFCLGLKDLSVALHWFEFRYCAALTDIDKVFEVLPTMKIGVLTNTSRLVTWSLWQSNHPFSVEYHPFLRRRLYLYTRYSANIDHKNQIYWKFSWVNRTSKQANIKWSWKILGFPNQ